MAEQASPTPKELERSLTLRFSVMLALFVVLLGGTYLVVSSGVSAKENDSLVVNVAGRQRMLIQQYTREINQALAGLAAANPAGEKVAAAMAQAASRTAERYDATLAAFLEGGEVEAGSGQQILLPPVQSADLVEQLKRADVAWRNLNQATHLAMRSEAGELNQHLQTIAMQTAGAVAEMDRAVLMMQNQSEEKLRRVGTYMVWACVLGALLFLGTVAFVRSYIVVPLANTMTTLSRTNEGLRREVVQRETAEMALRESDEQTHAILNTAPDAIISIDESGVIESVNLATTRLLGYGELELVGQNVRMLMPSPYQEEHDGYLEHYLRTGAPRIIGIGREVEARHKDGRVFPIRLSVGEVVTDRGRIFTGIIHDLSAQKQAEGERDESERRLRALFNQRASLSGLCTLEGILVDANKASLDYIGVRKSDVIDRPFWETPWWSHDPALQQQLRRGLERAAQGEFVEFEAPHPRVDGTMGTVDFSITPVTDSEGKIDILLVESIDVTQTRTLQEQLLQSQKMEAIGTLAGGIAHDFNNILTSIRGSSEILIDHLEPDGRLARSAHRIQRAADRATALTTRLLGFSRKQVTQRKPLDLNASVDEARELSVRTLREDVELKSNLNAEALYVRADESQLSQVLMNLVVNAADAMPGGGSLFLATTRESVHGQRAVALDVAPGEYAAIRVRDTGEGIAPETLGKIFDPFYTTKEVGKGTGLGLSISHHILRHHGGDLLVESDLGKGSQFTLVLPIA